MEVSNPPKKKSKLTLYIIICLLAGIALGFVLNKNYLAEENKSQLALELSVQEVNSERATVSDSTTGAHLESKKK